MFDLVRSPPRPAKISPAPDDGSHEAAQPPPGLEVDPLGLAAYLGYGWRAARGGPRC